MIKIGGDERKRDERVLKSISMENPDVFNFLLREQEHVTKGNGRMEADALLSMMFEANMKHRQIIIINRHLKCSSGEVQCAKRRMFVNQ